MRITVVGATGVLGRHVVAEVERGGHTVDVRSTTTRPAIDITDASTLPAGLALARPDAVLNLAAMTDLAACEADPERAHAVNAHGAGTLAAWCQDVGTRLVHMSTDSVFDGVRGGYREDDEPRPLNVYAASKRAGEVAVLAAGGTVVRANYLAAGPRFLLRWLFDELRAGHTVHGYTDARFSPLSGSDLAAALHRALVRDTPSLLHVGGNEAITKADVAVFVRDFVGSGEVIPSRMPAGAVARPHDTSLDSSLAREVLEYDDQGWRATTLAALHEMADGHDHERRT